MKITVNRDVSNDKATLSRILLDGAAFCYGLEDPHRDVKVPGETRIPAGTYAVKLRTEGGIHPKYADRYDFHRGMLWLQDVEGDGMRFDWVYIHTGNTAAHTEGCILTGYTRDEDRMVIGRSRDAYADLYRAVVDSAEAGELTVEVIDGDL